MLVFEISKKKKWRIQLSKEKLRFFKTFYIEIFMKILQHSKSLCHTVER